MNKFLLVFPTRGDNIENVITNKQQGNDFVKKVVMILERVDCEEGIEVYFELANKRLFLDDYQSLEELMCQRIGLYNLETILNTLVFDSSIKILKQGAVLPENRINLIDSFLEIDAIFTLINSTRTLNQNDFRHCEGHPNHISTKSPLIAGVGGFSNANRLLPSAIGDKRSNRGVLLNLDGANSGHIIRYEDENFNNQYHAFHIVKKIEGKYVPDELKIELLRNSKKNMKRALRIVEYRGAM